MKLVLPGLLHSLNELLASILGVLNRFRLMMVIVAMMAGVERKIINEEKKVKANGFVSRLDQNCHS